MKSEFNPEHSEAGHIGAEAGHVLDAAADFKIPCALCVLNAVRQGVTYSYLPPTEVVGQTYGNGHTIHEAVAAIAGTDVCWYHVDDVAKAIDL